jgi:hypothetical protein
VAAGAGGFLCLGLFGLALLFVYFIPSFVALMRGHPNAAAICVLNILAGWTFVGLVAALVWSFTAVPQKRKRYGYDSQPEWIDN